MWAALGMKAALVGADGSLLYEARRPTGRERGPGAVVESILGFAADLLAVGEVRYGVRAAAAGVAVPGIVDPDEGVAVYAANLGWRDVPLRSLLGERLGGLPVALGHDVRAGRASPRAASAQGAARTGSCSSRSAPASRAPSASAAPSRRAPTAAPARSGTSSSAPAAPPAGCGQRGCLETLASAAAVSRAWAEASGEPSADAADCAKAVEAGDPAAVRVWTTAVDALADGLVTALTLLDPRTLIIGGGLAEAGEALFTPLRAAVEERVTFQKPPSIVPAALGDTAGCLGAGLLAWDLLATAAPGGPAATDSEGNA